MNSLERRLKKIESILKTKHNHHGVFIIFINNGICIIQNQEEETKCFNSMQELETYIYSKYDCEKYVFITFDITNVVKDK